MPLEEFFKRMHYVVTTMKDGETLEEAMHRFNDDIDDEYSI